MGELNLVRIFALYVNLMARGCLKPLTKHQARKVYDVARVGRVGPIHICKEGLVQPDDTITAERVRDMFEKQSYVGRIMPNGSKLNSNNNVGDLVQHIGSIFRGLMKRGWWFVSHQLTKASCSFTIAMCTVTRPGCESFLLCLT